MDLLQDKLRPASRPGHSRASRSFVLLSYFQSCYLRANQTTTSSQTGVAHGDLQMTHGDGHTNHKNCSLHTGLPERDAFNPL